MNPSKHNFKLKYDSSTKQWSIYDNGTLHSDGYEKRKDAQDVIDDILGATKMSSKELGHFFKKWKNHIERT